MSVREARNSNIIYPTAIQFDMCVWPNNTLVIIEKIQLTNVMINNLLFYSFELELNWIKIGKNYLGGYIIKKRA